MQGLGCSIKKVGEVERGKGRGEADIYIYIYMYSSHYITLSELYFYKA
jgi:hypothetical protein